MTGRFFSTEQGGQRLSWSVPRLWDLSRDLPAFDYRISDFSAFDVDCWFGDVHKPTVRAVLDHMQRIEAADLSHPIILNAKGQVMDGVHRLCKAWLAGQATLVAVQFTDDPSPDRVEDMSKSQAPP